MGVVPVMELQRKGFPTETISDSFAIVGRLERGDMGGASLTPPANEALAWDWARRCHSRHLLTRFAVVQVSRQAEIEVELCLRVIEYVANSDFSRFQLASMQTCCHGSRPGCGQDLVIAMHLLQGAQWV